MRKEDLSIWVEMANMADNAMEAGFPKVSIAPVDLIALVLDAAQLRAALGELVSLKALKDEHGKTAEYEGRQPKAWAEARRVLASASHSTIPADKLPA